jgi:ribosomal protein L15
MGAGQPDFVVVNLEQLNDKFEAGQEVTLEALKQKKLVRSSGRWGKLPLKVRYAFLKAELVRQAALNWVEGGHVVLICVYYYLAGPGHWGA